jgi:hypothetical protein
MCRIHADAARNECNMYCLDCNNGDGAFCFYCRSSRHKDHQVIQVGKVLKKKIGTLFNFIFWVLFFNLFGKMGLADFTLFNDVMLCFIHLHFTLL